MDCYKPLAGKKRTRVRSSPAFSASTGSTPNDDQHRGHRSLHWLAAGRFIPRSPHPTACLSHLLLCRPSPVTLQRRPADPRPVPRGRAGPGRIAEIPLWLPDKAGRRAAGPSLGPGVGDATGSAAARRAGGRRGPCPARTAAPGAQSRYPRRGQPCPDRRSGHPRGALRGGKGPGGRTATARCPRGRYCPRARARSSARLEAFPAGPGQGTPAAPPPPPRPPPRGPAALTSSGAGC